MKLMEVMRGRALVLFVAAIPFSLPARDNPPQERNIRLHHFAASVRLDPWRQTLKGTASFDFTVIRDRTDSLVFTAPVMEVVRASLAAFRGEGKPETIRFRQEGGQLVVYPPAPLPTGDPGLAQYTLEVGYVCQSPPELHFTGWDDPTGRMTKQVWAHRPFGWIPFIDQMTTQDIRITFDKRYQVVSNGERVSKIPSGDTAFTWHYRLDRPHPFYSVCLAAGDYAWQEDRTQNGIPFELWYYPGTEDRVPVTYRHQQEMFSFLEKETGYPYPYGLYRNIPVADYLYGAMETTTSTVFGDYQLVDDRGFLGRNYINTNVHELAHQWFGNCINDLTVNDLWLTESFATYFAKIFERQVLGEEQYENQRDAECQKTLKIAESNNHPVGSARGGVERWYQKGSLVMDMLRDISGDTEFRAAVRYYMEQQAYGEAESHDFLRAFYETSGQTLDWFFEDWIYNGGEPEFEVRREDLSTQEGDPFVRLTVKQVQAVNLPGDLFRVPVTLEVYFTDGGTIARRVWFDRAAQQVDIPYERGRKADFVVFDAGNRILKKISYPRSPEMLLRQASLSHPMADRLEAVRALRPVEAALKREVLGGCFARDSFDLVRAEIVLQLAGDSLSGPLLLKACRDRSAVVRKAVTDNLTVIPRELVPGFELLLNDSAYYLVEAALVSLCRTFRDDRERLEQYLQQTAGETGWRGRNIRTAWLGIALQQEPGNKAWLAELTDYASPSFDFETRLNALSQLKALNHLDEISAAWLVKASRHWNPKLAGPAKEIIRYFEQQKKFQPLIGAATNQ